MRKPNLLWLAYEEDLGVGEPISTGRLCMAREMRGPARESSAARRSAHPLPHLDTASPSATRKHCAPHPF